MSASKNKEFLIRVKADIEKASADLKRLSGEVSATTAAVTKSAGESKKSSASTDKLIAAVLAATAAINKNSVAVGHNTAKHSKGSGATKKAADSAGKLTAAESAATAAINKNTIAVEKNTAKQAKAGAESKKVSQQTKKLSAENKEQTESYGELAGAVKAAAGAFVVYKLGGIIKDSALLASRNETLGIVLQTVARNANKTRGEVEGLVEDVKALGITTSAANKTVIQMTRLQLDLNKATALSRVAQDAAVVGSVNSSEALDRLLHGIVTLQPEVLRQIGITVSLEQEYSRFAKTAGISAAALTQNQKQQIAMNAVLREGEKLQGTYTAAMETANKQMGSLVRLSEEAENKFGKLFQPGFRASISASSGLLTVLNENLATMNLLLGTSGLETASFEKIESLIGSVLKQIDKIREEDSGLLDMFDAARIVQLNSQLEDLLVIRDKLLSSREAIVPIESLSALKKNIAEITNVIDAFKGQDANSPALKALEQTLDSLIKKRDALTNGDASGDEKSNAAAEKLNQELQKQLFILGENTEAKILYAVANGELIDSDGELVKKLLESARALDDKKAALKAAADEARNNKADNALIQSLAEEIALIGASNQASESLNVTRKLSADATDEQRAAVQALADAMFAATAAQKQFEDDMAAGLQITEQTRTADEKLAAQKAELNRLYREGALGAVGSAEAQETLNRALKQSEDSYDAMQKKGEQAYSALSSAAHSWSRDFADRLLDSERGFDDFVNEIIRQIQRIALTAALDPFFQSIAAGMGGFMGGSGGGTAPVSGSTSSMVAHTGGIAGGAGVRRSIDSSHFTNAPRFHSGGIAGNEVPAILQKGEGVFTKEQMANLSPAGGMAGGVNVRVEHENKGTAQQVVETQATMEPDGIVIKVITDDIGRGGPISGAFQNTFGLSRS
jgi:hypothetical protein